MEKTSDTIGIEALKVAAYRIPTDFPESDGTLSWEATTLVVVQVRAGGQYGLGYTYADGSITHLIERVLRPIVVGGDALNISQLWHSMVAAIRNLGRPGLCSAAVAAIDTALWDLKARLLDLPLVSLLGAVRDGVPVYGSGGFTSYPRERLQAQLQSWVDQGITQVKMKVGSEPDQDVQRVCLARQAIGTDQQLFVDANGAYTRKQALYFAQAFNAEGVTWFEEPVSSDDLSGLRWLRDRVPAGMDITAGEYGYHLVYFQRMLEAGAVDVLQADATRCAGFTEFLRVGALCQAYQVELSAHTAPMLHLHPCCALAPVRHIEYFHDHVRIEQMLFDGWIEPVHGILAPDLSRFGLGLEFRERDAERFRI